MEKVYGQYKDQMAFFALSAHLPDTMEIMREYKALRNLSFPFGLENGTGIQDFVEIEYYPTNIIIDRFGNVGYAKSMPMPSADTFERLVTSFMGPDYTESIRLTDIPEPKLDVAYPENTALSDALNAEGSSLLFTSDPEGKRFPFIPETREGRTAAYASTLRAKSRAMLCTSLDAADGDVLCFRVGSHFETLIQTLSVTVDGQPVKKLCGSYDWLPVVIPLTSGTHDVVFENETVSDGADGDWIAIAEVSHLTGQEARSVLDSMPEYARAAEDSISVASPAAREVTVFYHGRPIIFKHYMVEEDTVRLAVTPSETTDPDLAVMVSSLNETPVHLSELPYENGAFLYPCNVPSQEYAMITFAADPTKEDDSTTIFCVKGEENIASVILLYQMQTGTVGQDAITWAYTDTLDQN